MKAFMPNFLFRTENAMPSAATTQPTMLESKAAAYSKEDDKPDPSVNRRHGGGTGQKAQTPLRRTIPVVAGVNKPQQPPGTPAPTDITKESGGTRQKLQLPSHRPVLVASAVNNPLQTPAMPASTDITKDSGGSGQNARQPLHPPVPVAAAVNKPQPTSITPAPTDTTNLDSNVTNISQIGKIDYLQDNKNSFTEENQVATKAAFPENPGKTLPEGEQHAGNAKPQPLYPAIPKEQREMVAVNLDRSSESRSNDTDSVSTKHGSNMSHAWAKSIAKMFRGSKSSDIPVTTADIKETDAVIAVVGRLRREGKHAFVSDVIGDGACHGDNAEVQYMMVQHPHDAARNLFLAYTTGDNEKLPDSLRSISTWLSESCVDRRRLSGVIYLEHITASSASKAVRGAIEAVDKQVEKSNLFIATTGWSGKDAEVGERKEREMREQWKAFVDRGVSLLRLCEPGEASEHVIHKPWDIVNLVLSKADEKNSSSKRGLWKGKDKKPEDLFLDDPRSTDIVIPIMGPTGVGKSSFINIVTGAKVAKVGHNLKSETAQLQHFILRHPKDHARRVILVDTPGFDDTYVPDSEILRRIASWLARSYSANMKLAGVIYLHEISQTRMLGTSRKNLDMFNKLCGAEATKNVILATTKWSEVPAEVGERRELQLQERHWKYMLDLGSTLYRFDGTHKAGWDILNHIIDNANNTDVDAVEIQQELVEIEKILPETEAGRTLLYTLEELLEIQRKAATQLRSDDNSSELKDMVRENEKKIRATMKQINELSGPLSHRLKSWIKKLKFPTIRVEEDATRDS